MIKKTALILILGSILLSCGGENESNNAEITTNENLNSEKEIQPERKLVQTTACDLYEAYKENELKANMNYIDNMVVIENSEVGIVSEKTSNFGREKHIVVEIECNPKFQVYGEIDCYIKESELEKAVSLSKGQRITIRGVFTQGGINRMELKDCIITLQ